MMIGEGKNNKKRKNTTSNSSHVAFLWIKSLQPNGLPESFGSFFLDVTSDMLNNCSF